MQKRNVLNKKIEIDYRSLDLPGHIISTNLQLVSDRQLRLSAYVYIIIVTTQNQYHSREI